VRTTNLPGAHNCDEIAPPRASGRRRLGAAHQKKLAASPAAQMCPQRLHCTVSPLSAV